MSIEPSELPQCLADRLELSAAQEDGNSRLGNRMIRVRDKIEGPAFLKIGSGTAGQDLIDEADRLDWIGERLLVPRVLHRATKDDQVFVLVTELAGAPSHECFDVLSVGKVVEEFAKGLRTVHAIKIENCPFDRILEKELEESARRIGSPGLDIEAFMADAGSSPSSILDGLVADASQIENSVFTHGDYCFPNLLLDHDCFSGIVDWGIAGVGDRHRDFMSVELTIKRNCGKDWIPVFYEAYGVSDVDPERIRFFWLLDRFFAHYEEPSSATTLV